MEFKYLTLITPQHQDLAIWVAAHFFLSNFAGELFTGYRNLSAKARKFLSGWPLGML